MKQSEVLEFVVVPPYHQRHEVAASEASLKDFLRRRFRGYSFKIAGVAPVGDEDAFHAIPIMSFVDDEGKMRMCEPVQSWILREIEEACGEFSSNRSRRLVS